MITADQLVCHAIGDYVLQSDWMANEKTKRSVAALAHVLTYALPFLALRPSPAALTLIIATHFMIDRWRLARYVCWAKNLLAPVKLDARSSSGLEAWFDAWFDFPASSTNPPWRECSATGYPPDRPQWLAVWLLIIADNVLHVLCNAAALAWL